jgi:hypothetical protein
MPDTLTVKRGTVVKWRRPGFDEAGDVHSVDLKSGPRGVRKFHSEAAATEYTFKVAADRGGPLPDRLLVPRGDAHDDPRAALAALI